MTDAGKRHIEGMTVQELIDQLQKIDNKSKQVVVSVHQYNQVYPVAYLHIHPWGGHFQQVENEVRLFVWLPKNMYTSKRKSK